MGRGVLRPELAAARFQLARRLPSAGLAPFVEFYWILRWDLRGQPPHEQTILTRDFTATIGIPPTHYAAPAGRTEPARTEPARTEPARTEGFRGLGRSAGSEAGGRGRL